MSRPILPLSSAAWFAGVMLAMAVKHYVADFVLQTDWMARGKERHDGWLAPLAAHAGTHALGTLLVALVFRPTLWWLALCDFPIHACIDKAKTSVSHRTRWPIADVRFWWLMGFDQLLHQVTNIGLAVALLIA